MMKVIHMALTDQGHDKSPYRTEGDLTNLWELIQAAYEEDRQRLHEKRKVLDVEAEKPASRSLHSSSRSFTAPRRTS